MRERLAVEQDMPADGGARLSAEEIAGLQPSIHEVGPLAGLPIAGGQSRTMLTVGEDMDFGRDAGVEVGAIERQHSAGMASIFLGAEHERWWHLAQVGARAGLRAAIRQDHEGNLTGLPLDYI